MCLSYDECKSEVLTWFGLVSLSRGKREPKARSSVSRRECKSGDGTMTGSAVDSYRVATVSGHLFGLASSLLATVNESKKIGTRYLVDGVGRE
jgi:hypothetical protein